MITKVRIRGINEDGRSLRLVEEFSRAEIEQFTGEPETDASLLRLAHVKAAAWLEEHFPGNWCYKYGKLWDEVTLATPGVNVSYRLLQGADGHYVRDANGHFVQDLTKPYMDGVTSIYHIADGGFTGQFWLIDGYAGYTVPAMVDYDDPEEEARREAERERKRRALKAQDRIECHSCGGSGVYVGIAELDGAAVICSNCHGRGRTEDPDLLPSNYQRKVRAGVKTVSQAHSGYCLAPGVDLGAVSYEDFLAGKMPGEFQLAPEYAK